MSLNKKEFIKNEQRKLRKMEIEMENHLDNFVKIYESYCKYTEIEEEKLDKKMNIGFDELFDIIDYFRNYRFNGFVEKMGKILD